jgi:hypothetical protein
MQATRRTVDDIAASEDFYAGFKEMSDDNLEAYAAPEQVALYREPCTKCHGTGFIAAYAFREAGKCYQCDGAGFKEFKQPKEVRERNRTKARESKERRAQAAFDAFEAEHPIIAAWWTGSTFPFAVLLREACMKYGKLTEGADGNGGQLAAAYKCAHKFNEAKKAREVQTAAAPTIDISGLERAFVTAQKNGLQRVKLRLLGNDIPLLFQPANEHAKPENRGAVYVKNAESGEYLGKIKDGKFVKSRACSQEEYEAVIEACKAPEEAAVAFGRLTGNCSCCGRTLSNKLSVELGIGPICRGKFFG